ncbi:MAG: hypothetical protein Q4C33_00550 [bacterium]|nr:hypothetical protein [bacterium]
MKKNKRLIINVLLVAILVVVAIGRSYSYLSVNDSSNAKPENLKLQNGDIDIAFSGSNTIEFSNPEAKNTPIISKTFTLTGTNTSTEDISYYVTLVINENTFKNGSLKYNIVSNNYSEKGTVIENIKPAKELNGTTNITMGPGSFTQGKNAVHTYTLNIYYTEDKNDNGTFKGTIGISAQ